MPRLGLEERASVLRAGRLRTVAQEREGRSHRRHCGSRGQLCTRQFGPCRGFV